MRYLKKWISSKPPLDPPLVWLGLFSVSVIAFALAGRMTKQCYHCDHLEDPHQCHHHQACHLHDHVSSSLFSPQLRSSSLTLNSGIDRSELHGRLSFTAQCIRAVSLNPLRYRHYLYFLPRHAGFCGNSMKTIFSCLTNPGGKPKSPNDPVRCNSLLRMI